MKTRRRRGKLGGPVDLEPGTPIRVEWMLVDHDKGIINYHIIWAIVHEKYTPDTDGDMMMTVITGDVPESYLLDTWWALKAEDSWRVAKRPPDKFWAELAKWRLSQ